MKRTQIYISDEQDREITALAADRGVSKAAVIRRFLDEGLHIDDADAEARAAIEATTGICADYPDWPQWLRDVRGGTADDRLRSLGL